MSVVIGVSERKDGNMSFKPGTDRNEVIKNHLAFFQKMGISPKLTFFMKPKHGTKIVDVGDPFLFPKNQIEADGLYATAAKGVALTAPMADCLPIFLWNDKVIGLAHGGRTGILENICLKMMLKFIDEGLINEENPINIAIGGHIRQCCYRFSKDPRPDCHFWEWGYKFSPHIVMGNGSFSVGLSKKNASQLIFHGKYILDYKDIGECTCCTKEENGEYKYFSHVRSNNPHRFPGNHPEGRNLAVIMRT